MRSFGHDLPAACDRARPGQAADEAHKLVAGGALIPKRADALMCSNRCHQAQHRKRASLGSVIHPQARAAVGDS